MGQIQNAINNLAMTAAGGVVAKEMKTQGETLKGQLAVSQEQLAVSQKKAAELSELLDLDDELIEELLVESVNRDKKKAKSAVKMSQQQSESKSQQYKEITRLYEIAKRRGV